MSAPGDSEIDEALDETGMKTCQSLIAGLPAEWYRWPVRISVGFVQTPATCVYQKLFDAYSEDSMQRALDVILDEGNRELFISYRFGATGFIPAYGYYAAWPLSRKGKKEPTDTMVGSSLFVRRLERGIRRREPRGGAAPWELVPDDTLFEIWREPVNVYGSRNVLMLRAGGLGKADAEKHWGLCAKAIRQYRKRIAKSTAGLAGDGVGDPCQVR